MSNYFYYYDGNFFSGIIAVSGIGDGSPKTNFSMLDRYEKPCQPMLSSKAESHVAEMSGILQISGTWREIGLYADQVMTERFDEVVADCKFDCQYQ